MPVMVEVCADGKENVLRQYGLHSGAGQGMQGLGTWKTTLSSSEPASDMIRVGIMSSRKLFMSFLFFIRYPFLMQPFLSDM